MIKQIFTKNAPEAIGCYSQAVQYDKLLFSSGQIPVNPGKWGNCFWRYCSSGRTGYGKYWGYFKRGRNGPIVRF